MDGRDASRVMIAARAATETPLRVMEWIFKEIPPGIYGKVAAFKKQH
jgi:hypothetical protein